MTETLFKWRMAIGAFMRAVAARIRTLFYTAVASDANTVFATGLGAIFTGVLYMSAAPPSLLTLPFILGLSTLVGFALAVTSEIGFRMLAGPVVALWRHIRGSRRQSSHRADDSTVTNSPERFAAAV